METAIRTIRKIQDWNETEIQKRADYLYNQAIKIWQE